MRVGLIGWPVEHSVSPAMHNAAFAALGLPWRYTLIPVAPDRLEQELAELKAGGFRGVNVTVPHKQSVMPYLDETSEAARAIGAVNTIILRDGRLIGHNTDADGFWRALREAGYEPAGKSALVLGAGGAARAVVYALARGGSRVSVWNRTAGRARGLALDLQKVGLTLSVVARLSDLELADVDLLVNATSIGMWPHEDASPWPATLPIGAHWTVFDLIYNPMETRLLAQAAAAGARTIGGLAMLVHQGALAFELWTGKSPPTDVMLAAAAESLEGR